MGRGFQLFPTPGTPIHPPYQTLLCQSTDRSTIRDEPIFLPSFD